MSYSTYNSKTLRLTYDYGAFGYWYQFEALLHEARSSFQTIRVLQHNQLGRVLMLDDDIMSSEHTLGYDEAVLELIDNESRRDVLIMGGGDCSLALAMQDDPEVDSITIIEIDPILIAICEKYFGWKSKLSNKCSIIIDNAFEAEGRFDIVVDDMFSIPHKMSGGYYQELARHMAPAKIISQTDTMNSGVAQKTIAVIRSFCPEAITVERFIPDYMEHWTFTKYWLR